MVATDYPQRRRGRRVTTPSLTRRVHYQWTWDGLPTYCEDRSSGQREVASWCDLMRSGCESPEPLDLLGGIHISRSPFFTTTRICSQIRAVRSRGIVPSGIPPWSRAGNPRSLFGKAPTPFFAKPRWFHF